VQSIKPTFAELFAEVGQFRIHPMGLVAMCSKNDAGIVLGMHNLELSRFEHSFKQSRLPRSYLLRIDELETLLPQQGGAGLHQLNSGRRSWQPQLQSLKQRCGLICCPKRILDALVTVG
jgi:hypothetical protein